MVELTAWAGCCRSDRYPATADAKIPALERLNFRVEAGEFVFVLGPSGCGKTTLMRIVAGLTAPTSGAVAVDGVAVSGPQRKIGLVFQVPALMQWRTALDNVLLPTEILGLERSASRKRAYELLKLVGLAEFALRYPRELSGGMQQRVGIARALANSPKVLLMDEPFGSLDAQTRTMMQEVLLGIWEELHTTVLFVTHDIEEAIFLADRVIVMSAGPGRVIDDMAVPLLRPRHVDVVYTSEFVRLKRHCASLIRTESLRAFEQQNAEFA